MGEAGAVIYEKGDWTIPCTCWHRGSGRTGTTYGIDIRNGNRLRVGTEEYLGSSGRMRVLMSKRRKRRKMRESLGQ